LLTAVLALTAAGRSTASYVLGVPPAAAAAGDQLAHYGEWRCLPPRLGAPTPPRAACVRAGGWLTAH